MHSLPFPKEGVARDLAAQRSTGCSERTWSLLICDVCLLIPGQADTAPETLFARPAGSSRSCGARRRPVRAETARARGDGPCARRRRREAAAAALPDGAAP